MADLSTITSDMLQPKSSLVVPTAKPDQTPYDQIINGAISSLPDLTTKVDTAESNSQKLLKQILSNTADLQGKEQYSQTQQDLAGVNAEQANLDALNTQLTDLGAQMKGLTRNSQAIPLKVQQDALGRGQTDAGVSPVQTGLLRENAIKALTLASQGDILGAQITNSESRLARAKENAQKAVDLKYKPLEEQNAMLKDFLDLNDKYITQPAERKRAEAAKTALDERTRLLAEKKADEKTMNDLIVNAQSQLAPADVVSRAQEVMKNGGKVSDVIRSLGKYAGEYQQALMLQEQMATNRKQRELIDQNILQTKLENQKKSAELLAANPVKTKEAAIQNLGDTVSLIDGIRQSGGLSGFVGPTGLQRLSPISSLTGSGADFLASVNQLTSKQTLDTLINLKTAGGTLGALSEGEREELKNSASKINSWAIHEDGDLNKPVIGYKIDEATFNTELKRIRNLTNRAIENAGGKPIADPLEPNIFQQSMGVTSTAPIYGTQIINKVGSDGSIDFKIPTKVTR